jgi:hypothetical protein
MKHEHLKATARTFGILLKRACGTFRGAFFRLTRFIQAWIDALFGFDFFISYGRLDAAIYASTLRQMPKVAKGSI